jgi:hypothetical protein
MKRNGLKKTGSFTINIVMNQQLNTAYEKELFNKYNIIEVKSFILWVWSFDPPA